MESEAHRRRVQWRPALRWAVTISAVDRSPAAPPGAVPTLAASGTCNRPGCGRPRPKGRPSYCSPECHKLDGNRRQSDLRVRRGFPPSKPRQPHLRPKPPVVRLPVIGRLSGARILDHLLTAARELSEWRGHLPGPVIAEPTDRTFSCLTCGAWAVVTIGLAEDSAASGAAVAYPCGHLRTSAYTDRPDRGSLVGSPGQDYEGE